MEWREAQGIPWLEARLPGANVAFTTRVGGVSDGPYSSLNLGILTGDRRGSVVENRQRLAGVLGLDPESILIGRQVHGARVESHRAPQHPSPYATPGSAIPEVDGHVIAEPGLAALVFVADCLPIALSGPRGVAMLHCGWRGLAAGILAEGVAAIDATDAAIGPGIGRCCYEVREEVLERFASLGGEIADGRMLDLVAVAEALLREAGVARIQAAGLCTSCGSERFFSHRRDGGRTGRQAGLVWSTAGRAGEG
jgi:YfiH family protein